MALTTTETPKRRAHASDHSSVARMLRLAAKGEALARIVDCGAQELLDAGGADRAGVWILKQGQIRELHGVVVEKGNAQVPERWLKLDPNSPALAGLMDSSVDEILLKGADSGQMRFGPLKGVSKALWLPIHTARKPMGLALVAWREETAAMETSELRAIADVLGLAAACNADEPEESGSFDHISASDVLARALNAEAEIVGLANASDEGIILYDVIGGIRLINDRFSQLVAIPRQVLSICKTWHNLANTVAEHFRDPADFMQRWRDLASRPGDASWDEIQITVPELRRVERFVRPVRDRYGIVVGRLEIYRDVTTKRFAQSKLMQTDKMAGLGQLVSGIAHELNNPLTAIMGFAQLLLGRGLTQSQAADARLIYEEAERAARIVKNLLLFARDSRPERVRVQLNEIVEKTLALRNYELRVENIALSMDLDASLPPIIANPAQLQQVFLNLIVNAEQAIRQGAGEGSIYVRTWQTSHGRVALEIVDTGPGIPADVMPRIFDPFFTTKPPGLGTGLGLSIAIGILKAHGGEISVDSTPGHGAAFRVELPAADRGGTSVSPLGPASETSTKLSVVPRTERVLVVEDEPTVARLISDVLGEEGYPVEIVLDGEEGLRRALHGNYDLLICDLKMPHFGGRALHRELVAKGSPLQHRLVFVTGDTLAPRTMEFLESCGVPYLAKPFLVEELKVVVAAALESAAKRSRTVGAHTLSVGRVGSR
jgi:signal transduction histidine kinase/ActR/RegA family two-component response regulator